MSPAKSGSKKQPQSSSKKSMSSQKKKLTQCDKENSESKQLAPFNSDSASSDSKFLLESVQRVEASCSFSRLLDEASNSDLQLPSKLQSAFSNAAVSQDKKPELLETNFE